MHLAAPLAEPLGLKRPTKPVRPAVVHLKHRVLLKISGHGLDGSVVDTTFAASPVDLLGATDHTVTPFVSVTEPPINVSFTPYDGDTLIDCLMCTNVGLVSLSLLPPLPGAAPDDGTPMVNLILTALNFGTTNCNSLTTVGCFYDSRFPPAGNVTRGVLRDGKRVTDISTQGFTAIDALAATPATAVLTDDQQEAQLHNILYSTYTNGVRPVLGFGSAVPEPATWAELMLGAGLIGSIVRRRRALA